MTQEKTYILERLRNGSEARHPTPTMKTLGESTATLSSDEEWTKDLPGRPEPVKCEFCGEPRYHMGIMLGKDVFWNRKYPLPCTCPEGIAAYEKRKLEAEERAERERQQKNDREMKEYFEKAYGISGIGKRYESCRFDSFRVDNFNEKAYLMAKRYVDGFDKLKGSRGKTGLFIMGPPGTGKTHLACSIANELIARGKPVVCLTAVEVLRNAKKHFDQKSDRDPVDAYCAVPLMIIDDLGKTQHTDWALETLFAIIDKRYKDCLPTVVTANYGPDGLVDAMKSPRGDTLTARTIVDRLREMCFTVELRGTSHRA